VGRVIQGLADTIDGRISGGVAEDPAGAVGAIFPHGQGGFEMRLGDDGAAIEGGVDGAQAEDLGFGSIGGGAVEAWARAAEARVTIVPELAGGWVAAEGPLRYATHPVEGAAQLAGHSGESFRGKIAAIRKALASARAGPEATIGEAIVRAGAMKLLRELVLGDVADEADVRPGGLKRMMAVEGTEIAAIPGAAKQRGKVTILPCDCLEHAGKFLGEHEEAAIGGGLLVAQGVDKAVGGEAGGGDAAIDPKVVDLGEEAADLAPACTLAGLARFADEDNEQIKAVPGGLDHAMWAGPNHVAKGGKELQQNGGGIGLGVGGNGADDAACEAIGCCWGQYGPGSGSLGGR